MLRSNLRQRFTLILTLLTGISWLLVGCVTSKDASPPWADGPPLVEGSNITVLTNGVHTVVVPEGERRWVVTAYGLFLLTTGGE